MKLSEDSNTHLSFLKETVRLVRGKRREEAISIILRQEDLNWLEWGAMFIANSCVEDGLYVEAIDLLRNVPSHERRADGLAWVLSACLDSDFDSAPPSPSEFAEVLSSATESMALLAESRKKEEVKSLIALGLLRLGKLEEAFKLASKISEDEHRSGALCEITATFIKEGSIARAVELNELLAEGKHKNKILLLLVKTYIDKGQYDLAIETARRMKRHSVGDLIEMVEGFAEAGQFDHAFVLAQTSTVPMVQFQCRIAIAKRCPTATMISEIRTFLQEAMRIYVGNEKERTARSSLSLWFPELIQCFFHHGLHRELESMIHEMEDGSTKDECTTDLIKTYLDRKANEDASRLVDRMKGSEQKDLALHLICSRYLDSGDFDLAIQIMSSIESPSRKASSLMDIADSLLRAGQKERAEDFLKEAYSIAQSIEDLSTRELSLNQLSHCYSRFGDESMYRKTLEQSQDSSGWTVAILGIGSGSSDMLDQIMKKSTLERLTPNERGSELSFYVLNPCPDADSGSSVATFTLIRRLTEAGSSHSMDRFTLEDILSRSLVLITALTLGDCQVSTQLSSIIETVRSYRQNTLHFSVVIEPEDRCGLFAQMQEEEWMKYGELVIPLPPDTAAMFRDPPSTRHPSNSVESLFSVIRGLSTIFVRRLFQNVDFADFEMVKGVATLGIGAATGKDAHLSALSQALTGPLLKLRDLYQSKWLVVNLEYGNDLDPNVMNAMEEEQIDALRACIGSESEVLLCNSVNSLSSECRLLILCETHPAKSMKLGPTLCQ